MVSEWMPDSPLGDMWLGGGSQIPQTGTLHKQVKVMHFTWANNGSLTGNDQVLDTHSTENKMEMKRKVEQ